MKLATIYIACLFICTGYGMTFALFAILVEATAVSGKWLGINAALPAIGWVIGSLLVPVLQIRLQINIKKIALSFLGIAICGLCFPIFEDGYASLSATRFVFGGAMGVFLRCVEYILVANAPEQQRGKYLAIYGVVFMVGMIVGSLIQPLLGNAPMLTLAVVALLLCSGAIIFSMSVVLSFVEVSALIPHEALSLVRVLPIAFVGVFTYALYESVPAYLLQIFALRRGFEETTAVYTLSAAALGNLVLLFPLLALSDKIGRLKVLAICAAVAALTPVLLNQSIGESAVFLALVGVLGAAAGATYALSLAMIGDQFSGAALILGNAVFGVLYAIGSICGPLLHGVAMELAGGDGLMHSISTLFVVLLLATFVFASWTRRRNIR